MRIAWMVGLVLVAHQSVATACLNDSECLTLLSAPIDNTAAPMPTPRPACADRVCVAGICQYTRADHDKDGAAVFGALLGPGSHSCVLPVGYSFVADTLRDGDCNDTDDTIYPGDPLPAPGPSNWDGPQGLNNTIAEPSRCDGVDHDCNGVINDKTITPAGGGVMSCTCTTTANHIETAACNQDSQGNLLDIPQLPAGNCRMGIRYCDETGKWGPCLGAVAPQPHDGCAVNDDADCDNQPNDTSPCIKDDALHQFPCSATPDKNYCGGGTMNCDISCNPIGTAPMDCTGATYASCPFKTGMVTKNDDTKTCGDVNGDIRDPPILDLVNPASQAIGFEFGNTYGAKIELTFTPTLDCDWPDKLANEVLLEGSCDDGPHSFLRSDFDGKTLTWPVSECVFAIPPGLTDRLQHNSSTGCMVGFHNLKFQTVTDVSYICPPPPPVGCSRCDVAGRGEVGLLQWAIMILCLGLYHRRLLNLRRNRPSRRSGQKI